MPLVELVRVTTADGVRLDGALRAPAPNRSTPLGIDACVLVHGTGGNYYGSSLWDAVAERLTELGTVVAQVNTRGHDLLCTAATPDGPRQFGAAREQVDDCRHDLAAWVELLVARGHPRIGLMGHSLGAIKCVYWQALEPHLAVSCVVAISPARLSHAWFLRSPRADVFRRTLAEAERLTREGRGDTLLPVEFPIPYVVSAEGYLEKYGPDERYNVLRYVDRLTCPTLFVFGSQEVQSHVAFQRLPEDIEAAAEANPRVEVAVLAGADHAYSGARAELAARIEKWLRRAMPPA